MSLQAYKKLLLNLGLTKLRQEVRILKPYLPLIIDPKNKGRQALADQIIMLVPQHILDERVAALELTKPKEADSEIKQDASRNFQIKELIGINRRLVNLSVHEKLRSLQRDHENQITRELQEEDALLQIKIEKTREEVRQQQPAIGIIKEKKILKKQPKRHWNKSEQELPRLVKTHPLNDILGMPTYFMAPDEECHRDYLLSPDQVADIYRNKTHKQLFLFLRHFAFGEDCQIGPYIYSKFLGGKCPSTREETYRALLILLSVSRHHYLLKAYLQEPMENMVTKASLGDIDATVACLPDVLQTWMQLRDYYVGILNQLDSQALLNVLLAIKKHKDVSQSTLIKKVDIVSQIYEVAKGCQESNQNTRSMTKLTEQCRAFSTAVRQTSNSEKVLKSIIKFQVEVG